MGTAYRCYFSVTIHEDDCCQIVNATYLKDSIERWWKDTSKGNPWPLFKEMEEYPWVQRGHQIESKRPGMANFPAAGGWAPIWASANDTPAREPCAARQSLESPHVMDAVEPQLGCRRGRQCRCPCSRCSLTTFRMSRLFIAPVYSLSENILLLMQYYQQRCSADVLTFDGYKFKHAFFLEL